jgi:hypothetical protein
MGKVIIIYRFGKRESLKCKSRERALEIVKKRPNINQWFFYEDGERVPKDKPKEQLMPQSFEELELMFKKNRL